jgi:hypothetical protein
MIEALRHLTVAFLFGGMVLYSFGFAAFVFSALPAESAGPLLRKAFPHFYAFVIVTALVGAGLAGPNQVETASLLLVIAFTAIIARQFLMPAINHATDSGAKRRFKYLHTVSVVLTLGHILIAGYVLVRQI